MRMPYIEMLKENNTRRGFFERDQFEAAGDVRLHHGLATQESEILSLQWRQVDDKAGTVRLEPGTTKNREGRTFPMTPELRATLEAQRAATDALQRKTGSIIPWVFHRTKRGRPLKGLHEVVACGLSLRRR